MPNMQNNHLNKSFSLAVTAVIVFHITSIGLVHSLLVKNIDDDQSLIGSNNWVKLYWLEVTDNSDNQDEPHYPNQDEAKRENEIEELVENFEWEDVSGWILSFI